jgi:hypothetical protein
VSVVLPVVLLPAPVVFVAPVMFPALPVMAPAAPVVLPLIALLAPAVVLASVPPVVVVVVVLVDVSEVALVAVSAFLLHPAKAKAAVAAMTVTPSILDLISRISSFGITPPDVATAGSKAGSENVIAAKIGGSGTRIGPPIPSAPGTIAPRGSLALP